MSIDIENNKDKFLPSEQMLEYWKKNEYTRVENEEKLYIYNNFDEIKNYISDLKQNFLNELRIPLEEEKYKYRIVRKDWYYVTSIWKYKVDLWLIHFAKIVNYYQWFEVTNSFNGYKLEKVD
jgi:hypothetical protein